MSMNESRKSRGEARRSPARRALIISTLSMMVTFLIAMPQAAHAGKSTPEIDPSSMAGAVTLLIGGVLVLTDRIRRS